MASAVAGNSAWGDLSSLADEPGQNPCILIVDLEPFIRTKPTHLATEHDPASARAFFFFSPLTRWIGTWSSLYHILNAPHSIKAEDPLLGLKRKPLPHR